MTTLLAGLKAGFTLYGLGFIVGASLVSAAISITLSLAFFFAMAFYFRR